MSGWFVNYTEGDEHKAICIECFETFDKRESQREEFCSRHCAKKYENKIYGRSDVHFLVDTDPEAEPPVSACGQWGFSTILFGEVTCPKCLHTPIRSNDV